MKKIVVFAAVVLLSSSSFGQNTATEAVAMTQKMAADLGLTAEQTQQVSDINIGIAGKNAGVLSNTTYTDQQRADILKINKDAQTAMIKAVLTQEQIMKWEKKEPMKRIERTEEQAPKKITD